MGLTVVLTFVFYKPVSTVLEERETLINTNLSSASEKLLKADELCKQYEEQLKEAKTSVSQEVAQARKDAAKLIDQTNLELEAQKKLALQQLETQIDELSQLIKEKLLGKQ